MRKINFKDFIKDYREYYNEQIVAIRTYEDMEEVLFNIYNIDNFEIDYWNKLIELY